MKKEYMYASMLFGIIAIGIISISYFYEEVDLKRNTTNDTTILDKTFLRTSPELKGISGYINTSSEQISHCLLYTSPSPRDATLSRMPSSA